MQQLFKLGLGFCWGLRGKKLAFAPDRDDRTVPQSLGLGNVGPNWRPTPDALGPDDRLRRDKLVGLRLKAAGPRLETASRISGDSWSRRPTSAAALGLIQPVDVLASQPPF